MPFEVSKFGDGSAAGAGNVVSTVHNHYGPRKGGLTVGGFNVDGVVKELSIDIDGKTVGDQAFQLFVPKLPKGALIRDAFVEVLEVFSLGGTTPAIRIGTKSSEATNGVSISEAQAEALGMYNITSTLAGTWANPLGGDTTVGVALSGTSPTATVAGKARVVIRYAQL